MNMFITATATAAATSQLATTSCRCVSQCELYLFHKDVNKKTSSMHHTSRRSISIIGIRSMLIAFTATATYYVTHHFIHMANLYSVLI